MTKKRFFALLLALVMIIALPACSKKEADDKGSANDTPTETKSGDQADTPSGDQGDVTSTEEMDDHVLVIGVDATFEEKWNPFLVESAYDHQAVDQVFTAIQYLDDKNELVDYGGSLKTEEQADGTVLYTITVNEGMRFSDGVPVTIDDYLYALYVKADPSYTGKPGSLLGSFIEGINEYYYDDPNYSTKIAEFEELAKTRYAADKISFEDFLIYAKATALEGWWSGDPAGDIGNGMSWSEYAESSGYTDQLAAIDASNADQMFELIARIEYDEYVADYNSENWFLEDMKMGYATGNLDNGVTVPEISGIKRIDDYTCTIKYTKIDIYADRGLTTKNGAGNLIPRHYYGEFEKGDTSAILANMEPMGSGPYIWGGFENNIITCTANMDFFLGAPKTGTVRWQYFPPSDIMPSLASGALDITVPKGTKENVAELEQMSNVRFDMIDNAGYGYMAMNTQNVPLNVRKGLWCLMNRQPSVEGYYGGETLAKVIERPMTTTLAEYPQDAQPYYPVSRDEALKYFELAGYTQKDGKLVDASGKQLSVNCYIGGSGEGDHPAFAMLVQAAEDMAALGGEIQIQDVEFSILQGAMNDGTADAWIMAWSDVFDCDKSSQFHSEGGQNRYRFYDTKMDGLLETIVQTIDLNERRALVSEMLDYAMDQCLEFPLYQRKNIVAYNSTRLNLDSIPIATTSCNYEQFLYQVEMID